MAHLVRFTLPRCAILAALAALACSSDPERSRDSGDSGAGGAGSSGGSGTGAAPTSGGGTSKGGASSGGKGGASSGGTGGDGASTGGAGGNAADSGAGGSADGGSPPAIENPWGIAPSASSSRGITSWAAGIAETGIGWVRGFDGAQLTTVMDTADANGLSLAGIFFYSDPGPASFPVNDLAGLTGYVTDLVEATRGRVKHYEVWNEPPNFSENKDPTAYAQVVQTAYDATKAADPTVQVGLAAQSVNLSFLAEALEAGAAGHFDYVTVHPYETLGMVAEGWEAEFMSIVPTIRKLLADKSPGQSNVPVWFTELGEPVGGAVSEEHQADTLTKAYILGIAQGVTRVHWFEPLDGDSGPFGLIRNDGSKRPGWVAVKTLVEHVGENPRYDGWVLLGGESYGFVFDGPAATVMVTWAPPGTTKTVSFGETVGIIEPGTGDRTDAASYELGPSPVVVTGVPAALRDEARANYGKPFPWGGDYTNAASVSFTAPATAAGLHPFGASREITVDGVTARDQSASGSLAFTVDPNFLSYTATRIEITVVLRRNGADNAGFNIKYEGPTGWKGTGSWYTIPGSDQWYTHTVTIDDPQFVGKWAYNFAFDSDSTQFSNYAVRSVTVTKR